MSIVGEVRRYWEDMVARAFWDSMLFFFETRNGVWKALGLALLGMVVTFLIVRVARDREALTEHVKSNVLIVIAGGLATWVLVFLCYFIAEPFMQFRVIATEEGKNALEVRSSFLRKSGDAAIIFQREQEITDLKKRPVSCPKCEAGSTTRLDILCQNLADCPSSELAKRAAELINRLRAITGPYDTEVLKWISALRGQQHGSPAYNDLERRMNQTLEGEKGRVMGEYGPLHVEIVSMRDAMIKRIGHHDGREDFKYDLVGAGQGNPSMVKDIISDLSRLTAEVHNLRQHE